MGRTSPGGAAHGTHGSGATVRCRAYDTNFGNPDIRTNQFAHLDIALQVARSGWPLRLEVLVPPLLIIGLCLVALGIDPTQLEARLTILVPALIAAVALHIATASNLPLESHASYIDDLYVVSYGVVVAIVLISIRSHRQRRATDG